MRLLSTVALILAGSTVAANAEGWDYRTTLYLWFPGISTTVETPFGSASGDVSASDALSALDMGFMGTVAAQNGPWIFWGDLVYTDISATNAAPQGLAFTDVRTKSKMTTVTAYALYDVNPAPEIQVAFGGGARFIDMSLQTSLLGGSVGDYSHESGDSWMVPVLAAQVFAPINEKWFVSGVADWGMAGNDNETWQVYAGLGYRFNEKWSTQIGYRYMDVTKDLDNGNVDLGMGGVLLGVTYEF